ncbi:hypothetical protein [Coleofasciculus sp. F4-SAH-05]|uniref:hypothetical protein n=1 Tax=Coleofasciculus sp. F4-SAH-05 TaxID=3069525 RepID=UPI0032F9063C
MSDIRKSLLFVIRHWSFVICHSSLVICHLSFVIGHLSFVICHLDRAGLVTLGWTKNDSSETRPYT